MRLWERRLLSYLPDKFIIAQWRECIAIKRQWEKGTLKHRLVSYVMDYSKYTFYEYVLYLCSILDERNIQYKKSYLEEIHKFCGAWEKNPYAIRHGYDEHNDRYLRQCLYNLEEKATRNIITKSEWLLIYNQFKDFTDLWGGD